jgi:hypothetical protein
MLSSDAILQDISRCLLSPLTISLSLHSQVCTPCMSTMSQYEEKATAMQQQSKTCSSHLCPAPDLHRNLTPSFPSLHMSEDSLTSSRGVTATASSLPSQENTKQSLRKTATVARTAFPQHLFPLISTEIQSRNISSSSRAMRSLVCHLDPQLVPSAVPSDQETLCSYLLFIRRAFYSAQVSTLSSPSSSSFSHGILPACRSCIWKACIAQRRSITGPRSSSSLPACTNQISRACFQPFDSLPPRLPLLNPPSQPSKTTSSSTSPLRS